MDNNMITHGHSHRRVPTRKVEVSLEQKRKIEREIKISRVCSKALQTPLLHRDIPNALRGIPGMLAAHNMLLEKDAKGLLIGGLAYQLYHSSEDPELLERHKDTDVLILNKRFKPGKFEGGIDWWVPFERDGIIYWKNGFDAVLRYSLNGPAPKGISDGLNILDRLTLADMRGIESLDFLDQQDLTKEEYEETAHQVVEETFERLGEQRAYATLYSAEAEEKFSLLESTIKVIDPKIEREVDKNSNRYFRYLKELIRVGSPLQMQYALSELDNLGHLVRK